MSLDAEIRAAERTALRTCDYEDALRLAALRGRASSQGPPVLSFADFERTLLRPPKSIFTTYQWPPIEQDNLLEAIYRLDGMLRAAAALWVPRYLFERPVFSDPNYGLQIVIMTTSVLPVPISRRVGRAARKLAGLRP